MQPPRKQRPTVTYLLSAVAIALIAFGAAAMPHLRTHNALPPPLADLPPAPIPQVTPVPPAVHDVPRVEVVFALDTTGSMSGLIDGAKRKVWSIVNFLSSAQPQPEVRIGLVGYRDLGDAYVTRFYDLSDDLDGVFQNLSSFQAQGGGDTPEHVAKALSDAVERTHWSDGKNVVKLIYVVGDAPPHTDYNDGYDYQAIAKKAAKLGIRVNTIRCGDDPDTERYFAEIARLGQGQFASIAQSGGVADTRTPYDDKLAGLNRRLMDTAIGYGEGEKDWKARFASVLAAPASVIADRASAYANMKRATSGEAAKHDLVETFGKGGAGALAAVPAADLPAAMATMTPTERNDYVAKKKSERDALLGEIKTVATARSHFLDAKPAKPGSAKEDGFDDRVKKSLVDESRGVLRF